MKPAARGPRPCPADATSQIGRVVLALREMVLRGEFRPGKRLAELTLAPLLKASRTPVRLALDRLAHEGLLVALPKGGFKVREFTIADIWDAIEVRGVLEGTAARMAAERLSGPDELAELRRCCWAAGDSIPTDAEKFSRYLEMNGAFHQEVWRLAKSPVLIRALESVVLLPFAGPNALVFGPGGICRISSRRERSPWNITARSWRRSRTVRGRERRAWRESTRGCPGGIWPERCRTRNCRAACPASRFSRSQPRFFG